LRLRRRWPLAGVPFLCGSCVFFPRAIAPFELGESDFGPALLLSVATLSLTRQFGLYQFRHGRMAPRLISRAHRTNLLFFQD